MTLIPIIPLGIAPTAREPQPLNFADEAMGRLTPSNFCGALPAELGAAARNQMRWRQRHLQWCWIDRIPGLTPEKQVEDSKWAFEQWSKASNGWMTFEPTSDAKACDIILTTARIDGSGRVLADMMLPPGDDRQLRGRFDAGEQWDVSIIFKLVLLHELGHAMGLDHINDGKEQSVLDSIYNPRLTVLQRLDVIRYQAIYPECVDFKAPTTPTTPPPSPSDPTRGRKIQISIEGLGVFSGGVVKIAD